jgi:hypothetical protein
MTILSKQHYYNFHPSLAPKENGEGGREGERE